MSTPGYDDGWFNGNPYQMIRVGSYPKYRTRISKNRTELMMSDLDKLWSASPANPDNAKKKK